VVLFSRCYGGEYCAYHPDHSLQAGFLTALYLFLKEYSGENEVEAVLFKRIRMDFAVDDKHDVIIVFVNHVVASPAEIRAQLAQTIARFVAKYQDKLEKGVIVKEDYDEFEADLQEPAWSARIAAGRSP
jgi:hypothetical protein